MKSIVPPPESFKCHMDNKEEVNFFFCQQYCMYYQGNIHHNEKNLWYGCFYDEEKNVESLQGGPAMIEHIRLSLIVTNKEKKIFYVCPFDKTYSEEMEYLGKIAPIHVTFDERKTLNDSPIIGERLKCPKCQNVFGWHQLEKVKDK